MPDTQIVIPQVQAAPATYTVKPAVEFILKSVRATFDGSGASGDFVPVLTLISDSGHEISESADAGTFPAGASGRASFFPRGLARKSTAAAAGTTFASISASGFVTVPAISGGSPGTAIIGMDTTTLYTTDSSVFTASSYTDGSGTYDGVGFNAPGHYLSKTQVILQFGGTSGLIQVNSVTGPGIIADYGSEGFAHQAYSPAFASDGYGAYVEQLTTVTGSFTPMPTDPVLYQVSNGTTVNMRAYCDMIVYRLDADQTVL